MLREVSRGQVRRLAHLAPAEVLDEIGEVALIGIERGDRQTAFDAEIGEEVADVG